MKKTISNVVFTTEKQPQLTILKMKLSLFLTFLFICQLSAGSIASQNEIVLNYTNTKLKTILNDVKTQSGYNFFYNVNEINDSKKVTIAINKETLEKVLRKLSKVAGFEYAINKKQIVLTKIKLEKQIKAEVIQEMQIKGKITDSSGEGLPYMNIVEKGNTSNGMVSDDNGEFSITVKSLPVSLIVSSMGFATKTVLVTKNTYLTIVVQDDNALNEIVLVGSRGKPRTAFDSPVPIDNIKISELTQTGQGVLDQQLMFKVPSYNSTQQPVSDAGAHFSPADLRGLFPSRTLVLVNGKRKNASALVYSYVTPGRGEVGVDMKSVPSAALERVEILRDGAAAQYGSDAVAGVINLVLKKSMDPFINTSYSVTSEGDGEQYQLETGFGVNIRDKGYANFTLNYFDAKRTQRAGTITSVADEAAYWGVTSTSDFNTTDLTAFLDRNPSAGFQVGTPDMTITNFSYNAGYTLDEETQTEVYSFGTLANRSGSAPQFARVPYWVTGFEQIYPGQDFFLAEMSPQINDNTLALGIKTVYNGWNFDLSSTTGKNRIDYYITNSFNQSYGASSPSDFYNGAHQFSHIVNNLDVVKTFEGEDDKSISVAFGAEHRTERFVTEEGELASYADGTPNVADRTGSESFGGFKPENASDDYRSNIGIYTDISADLSKAFLIGGALRFENYSDFGSNISWKLNSRWKTDNDKLSIRGSVSSGFRAPSLHQMFYTAITTTLTANGIQQNGILNNSDPALRGLGIPELSPETSNSIGAGISYRITRKLGFTVDVYQIDVDDRIALSGQVTPTGDATNPIDQTLNSVNVGAAGFFLNAIDTRTKGIDLVFSYDNIQLGAGILSGSIAANFNKTEVTGFNFPKFIVDNNLQNAIFSREDISRVETWRPRQKIIASANYKINKFTAGVSFMNYGEVTYRHASDATNDATFGGKTLTDINVSYGITEKINISLGVNNLFNVYPDTFAKAYSNNGGVPNDRNLDFVGRFKYPWQTTQFGIDGTRVFTKLAFTF